MSLANIYNEMPDRVLERVIDRNHCGERFEFGGRWLQIALSLLVSVLSLADVSMGEEVLDKEEKQAIEELIEAFILENPEVVLRSIEGMRERERLQVERETKTKLIALADDIFYSPGDPVIGNPNGDVTVVEFLDYRCGYCKKFFTTLSALIAEDEQLRVVFKELPILGPPSERVARIALAASRQDLYLEFHSAMMNMRGSFDEDRIFAIAEEIGLDMDRLRSDMASTETEAVLENASDLARQLSVTGTPAIIVGSNIVRGAIDKGRLKAMVAAARAE